MNKMKKLISLFLMATSVMITIYVVGKHYIQNNMIKPCTSNLVIVNKDSHLDLLIDFISFENNSKGKLTVNGVYFIGAAKNGIVRRQILFSMVNIENNYTFKNIGTIRSIRDETMNDEGLKMSLPDFFIKEGGELTLSVTTQGSLGYVFASGSRPVFYCELTRNVK